MFNINRGRGLSRDVRLMQIMLCLWALQNKNGAYWVDARSISKQLGMSKSSHFMGMLKQLMDAGWVHMSSVPHRPNQAKHMFHLDTSTPYQPVFNYDFACVFNDRERADFVLWTSGEENPNDYHVRGF